ncbi:IclR family transcriptional regulator [Egicoccus sp. AB-alg2]|uniref:IclR family transcriptional regulator n=1 Tax=Egicoccus sp. AB-alg2 TaxID=3242693 RepID=UPI00359E3186
MSERPTYAITSVDHALQLARLLQREGSLGVRDAAAHLAVSPSTAHRLLAMLVYREFAEQGPDRRYYPGPVLQRTPHAAAAVAVLRQAARPHMVALVNQVGESANLTILAGTAVHFVSTVESPQPLRAGDRTGASLPAHRTSGGKAMLASLPPAQVEAVYAGVTDVDVTAFLAELEQVRRHGYAINDQQTETGLSAIGVAVRLVGDTASAALSLAVPSVRFHPSRLGDWSAALWRTADAIEREVARAGIGRLTE